MCRPLVIATTLLLAATVAVTLLLGQPQGAGMPPLRSYDPLH